MPCVTASFAGLPRLDTFGCSFKHIYWDSVLGTTCTQLEGTTTGFARLTDDLVELNDQAL